MPYPLLYLFYPRRNPSLSYTRQVQSVIAFILFVLITVSSGEPQGALFIPSLGASMVIAITSIFLAIATTDLSRKIEDQLEKAVNFRLQRIAPHHARIIKNNLQSTPTRKKSITLSNAGEPQGFLDQKTQVDLDEESVNQFEIVEVIDDQLNNQVRIVFADSPGIRPPPSFTSNYINDIEISYQHVKEDALAIAESLVADPPILIDPRMIMYKVWQRPGGHAGLKEIWRWICYLVHILIYTSPVWWAVWLDLSLEWRLISVIIHSFVLLLLIGLVIVHDFKICKKALEDGDVEKYLYRLYDTHRRVSRIEHLPYNRSLYIMHLLNVIANHYKSGLRIIS